MVAAVSRQCDNLVPFVRNIRLWNGNNWITIATMELSGHQNCCTVGFQSDKKLQKNIPTAWAVGLWGGVCSQRQSRFERATRSLATFAHTAHLLCSLCFDTLALLRSLCFLTPFTGLLSHFAHSVVGQLKFLNMCPRCKRVVTQEETRCCFH